MISLFNAIRPNPFLCVFLYGSNFELLYDIPLWTVMTYGLARLRFDWRSIEARFGLDYRIEH